MASDVRPPPAALERDSEACSNAPDDPATLSSRAEQQLEPIGQPCLSRYLDACAARRIINDPAIDDRAFRINDQFGQVGISARRPHAYE
jgi:hypothetical protein